LQLIFDLDEIRSFSWSIRIDFPRDEAAVQIPDPIELSLKKKSFRSLLQARLVAETVCPWATRRPRPGIAAPAAEHRLDRASCLVGRPKSLHRPETETVDCFIRWAAPIDPKKIKKIAIGSHARLPAFA
jgi:hypothetical protein